MRLIGLNTKASVFEYSADENREFIETEMIMIGVNNLNCQNWQKKKKMCGVRFQLCLHGR